MEYLTVEYLVWAITLGGISALSLPLGSWVGLQANPRPQIVSILAAFGAGALIAGLFLSNFPEAMASSANMQTQGFSKHKVFMLWFSLLVITAAGAGAGFLLADALRMIILEVKYFFDLNSIFPKNNINRKIK